MPFKSPNYTQAPNEFFDEIMRDLGYAELKVVLAVIRMTFGFHRKSAKATLTTMCRMTGLTRYAVLEGAKKAEERGLIERNYTDTGELIWVVQLVNQGGSASEPSFIVLNKEKKNGADAPEELIYDGYLQ